MVKSAARLGEELLASPAPGSTNTPSAQQLLHTMTPLQSQVTYQVSVGWTARAGTGLARRIHSPHCGWLGQDMRQQSKQRDEGRHKALEHLEKICAA
eukprot:6467832-Amphidinium_carterae.1